MLVWLDRSHDIVLQCFHYKSKIVVLILNFFGDANSLTQESIYADSFTGRVLLYCYQDISKHDWSGG